jgi:hypothetical protein
MKQVKASHVDAGIKGLAAGVVSYAANQYGLNAELTAAIIPAVVVALSWVSTKVGDKNTALFVKFATEALAKAPAKKAAAKKKA